MHNIFDHYIIFIKADITDALKKCCFNQRFLNFEEWVKGSMAKKISKISVVDQVCSAIKQDIIDGKWKVGDKLPTELEFSVMFGVNRLSVRMALQKLSTLGLIETRVGEGSFVKDFSLKPFLVEIGSFYEDEASYNDVRQLRFLLETECMRLAAANADNDEKAELKEKLNQYYSSAEVYAENFGNEELLDALVDSDFAFHYQTVRMSHNRVYSDVYYMVQQLIRNHIKELIDARMRRRHEKGLSIIWFDGSDTHSRIYNAIVNGDEKQLKELSEEMLGIRPVKNLDEFDQSGLE